MDRELKPLCHLLDFGKWLTKLYTSMATCMTRNYALVEKLVEFQLISALIPLQSSF